MGTITVSGEVDAVLRSPAALEHLMVAAGLTVRTLTDKVNSELARRQVSDPRTSRPIRTSKSAIGQLRSGERSTARYAVATEIERRLGCTPGALFTMRVRSSA